MALIEPLISTQTDSSGGSTPDPLVLGQIHATSQLGANESVAVGVTSSGGLVAAGGIISIAAPNDGVTSSGAVSLQKESNASGVFTAQMKVGSIAQVTDFRFDDPGNTKAPIAYGKVLGTTTGAVVFNGDTTGATSETTILTGTLLTNTAAPGMQVYMNAGLSIDAVNGADTLTLRLKRGGSTILTASLDSTDVGACSISWTEIIQSIGASGNIYRAAVISGPSTSGADGGARTLATNSNQTYALTAQWSSNNAGNQATFNLGYIHYKM